MGNFRKCRATFCNNVCERGIELYKIVKKQALNPYVSLIEVDAPYIAKKAEPGQFIILRIDEKGERVPFTIADYNRETGTITIIF